MDDKQKDEQIKYYGERRADLEKIRSDSIDCFDKAILQVSTGALVITITFIDKIGKPYNDFTNILLITFWSLFLGVILVNIFSYWTAQKNMDFKINDIDARYKQRPDNWQSIPEKFSKFKITTEICNQLALWLFVIGAILFFLYAYKVQIHNYQSINKGGTVIMTDDKKTYVKDGKTETSEKQPPKRVEPIKQPEKSSQKIKEKK